MPRWRCPRCDRQFGRRHQSHTCVPAGTLVETLAGFPDAHSEICRAIIARAEGFGPVHIEPVGVGIFLAATGRFAELRPRQRWMLLYLILPTSLDHPRIRRSERLTEARVMHVIRLDQPAEVDDELADWLGIGYDAASG